MTKKQLRTPATIQFLTDAKEWRAINELLPYARNARTHDDAQIAQLAAGFKEWGFVGTVLIKPDNTIIAGHGRVMALRYLGIDKVPVTIAEGWTDAQCRAFIIADNQLALNAGWNEEMLALELQELQALDFELPLIGFGDNELKGYLAGEDEKGKTDPDEVPAPPVYPTSQPGDIWILGDHRLACGDSTDEAVVKKLLAGEGPHIMLTDPPYCSGGFQEAGKGSGSIGTRGDETIANDTLSSKGYQTLIERILQRFKAGGVYIFTDWRMWNHLFESVESCGYGVRNMVVWNKGTPGMGRGWRMQHELVMAATKVKQPFDPKSAQGNVITEQRSGNKNHPTEKPVALLEKIINVNDFAATVCDPFGGSGSTIIACERTGRRAFVCELSPKFVDVAIRRWQDHTGKDAIRESDGKRYNEIDFKKAEGTAKIEEGAGSADSQELAENGDTRTKAAAQPSKASARQSRQKADKRKRA